MLELFVKFIVSILHLMVNIGSCTNKIKLSLQKKLVYVQSVRCDLKFLKSDDLQPPLYTDMSFRVDCPLVEKLYVLCYRIEKNYSWFYFAVHYRCMIQIWRSLCCSIYLGASSSSS